MVIIYMSSIVFLNINWPRWTQFIKRFLVPDQVENVTLMLLARNELQTHERPCLIIVTYCNENSFSDAMMVFSELLCVVHEQSSL